MNKFAPVENEKKFKSAYILVLDLELFFSQLLLKPVFWFTLTIP